jgi:hypothetical protein
MRTYPYTIENGAGERLTFLGVTRDANGDRIEVDGVARPGAGPPPDNVEFYLAAMFASMKENGGKRPGLFDAAFLTIRYRTEFAMLELPMVMRRLLVPIIYVVGLALGKYTKYKDAPPPIQRRRA